ncbi:Re/Si-specific NAD(P)(+) transhydrogenase subunit alpha [Cellvibrio japonicus]|uniref:NAD(P) transhydrogenase subunit alpha part 1 n=1 Tax=Cellvibrio japonicus (strain Ueda107) TaxID=498211 RepID=B3PGC0_CELJU|nr:Re/Si-specific NAD(P)(+) transhydrogenase subunit alpha [Cellvibrio japonicus]ACE86352.1 proton-translocating nicotinamide nucleotide transhydrogenase subunit PntAA [Cellvibrio japonicus Ueda107]QEI10917.1 Re/Si-specific NAD(P)(+) transhydrogenase subunit alpha [Cellvibrio japonicus]QEI14493.1 Re/Si-specific NAD(P)(+) transhydrogenase subunit alpha [Cellvibrio japonicus]QEI18071.1 Re/Si-specific NAD(P)(+) transhydrogenase subunit alpha [Cellvibrio japonicus]
MRLAIPKERRAHERRVAATPETVKKFIALGFDVTVEAGAGLASRITDEDYRNAGASVVDDPASLLGQADVVLKVQRPLLAGEGELDELSLMKRDALLVAILSPYADAKAVEAYAKAGVTSMALEFVPRITRAQSMDVLSSQSNLAGYRAVLEAINVYDRAMPMMMTAAGTVAPARVMVLGAGVAGLQAIATARRLGAIVSATDVRPASKEQVESLGGKFIMVESEETKQAETAGGYAKEMSDDYKRRQAELVAETLKKQDIAICTALIPGRKAPTLINDEMVYSMRPGSVIVDLAAEQGGNCTLTKPGEVVEVNGVTIIGLFNIPSRISADASALYAKNLLNYLTPLVDTASKQLAINWQDEIVAATTLTRAGEVVHPNFKAPSAT